MPSRNKKKSSTNSPSSPPKAEASDPIEPTVSTEVSTYAAIGLEYARNVIAGRILACKWVKLACQRHLDDLERTKLSDYPFVFDEAKANRICRFLEQLPHTKGDWARTANGRDNRIKLEPWQCFIFSSVFGWVRRSSGLRRFQIAYICIPRKNGKSLIAAGTGLYVFASDGEMGAEVYAGATCRASSTSPHWSRFSASASMAPITFTFSAATTSRPNALAIRITSTIRAGSTTAIC